LILPALASFFLTLSLSLSLYLPWIDLKAMKAGHALKPKDRKPLHLVKPALDEVPMGPLSSKMGS
jgi:hypothetical protein